MADLVECMKRAAVEAVKASKPVSLMFGVVVEESPLKVNVEQKLTLEEEQLVLTRNVMDFEIEITVVWETSAENIDGYESHSHSINGKKKMKVHNALKKGDKLLLLRMTGGQKFVIMDRVMA